jgi:hypothetical protein
VLSIAGPDEIESAVRAHHARIAEEVLALRITVGTDAENSNAAQSVDIDGLPASIAIERAV